MVRLRAPALEELLRVQILGKSLCISSLVCKVGIISDGAGAI